MEYFERSKKHLGFLTTKDGKDYLKWKYGVIKKGYLCKRKNRNGKYDPLPLEDRGKSLFGLVKGIEKIVEGFQAEDIRNGCGGREKEVVENKKPEEEKKVKAKEENDKGGSIIKDEVVEEDDEVEIKEPHPLVYKCKCLYSDVVVVMNDEDYSDSLSEEDVYELEGKEDRVKEIILYLKSRGVNFIGLGGVMPGMAIVCDKKAFGIEEYFKDDKLIDRMWKESRLYAQSPIFQNLYISPLLGGTKAIKRLFPQEGEKFVVGEKGRNSPVGKLLLSRAGDEE